MTTTALLCIARNEKPFTEEWLEYHLALGIERVYYVSTDDDFPAIQRFFEGSRFRSKVEIFHFNSLEPGWQIRCYNAHLPFIQEDWILVLDVDEFLYLQSWGSIQELLESVSGEIAQIQFPWLNVVSYQYRHERTLETLSQSRKHLSDHVKSVVRRRPSTQLGVHSHRTSHGKNCLSSGLEAPSASRHSWLLGDADYCTKHPFILHLASRGHSDILLRILEQRFFNAKCGPDERRRVERYLREAPDWRSIPTRYMLMQFWSSLPSSAVQCRLPEIESRTDVHELKTAFLRSMNRLMGFDCAIEDLDESFESQYRLAEKVRSQSQTATYRVNDYLKRGSQLEYIEDCRSTFEEHRTSREGAGAAEPVESRPVFIHVSKNAGNSIIAAAGHHVVNAGHRTAASWIREKGDSGPIFAVIRNPFDRVVSEYLFRKRRYDQGEKNPHLSNLHKSFEDWTISTFRDEELRTRAFFEDNGIAFNERNMIDDCLLWFLPQVYWLGDEQGRPLLPAILRFENLENDWSTFAKKYAIPGELPRRNASVRVPDYRQYYSGFTRDLVGDYYREDLEAFGYTF